MDDEEFYLVAEEIINVLSHVYECTYDQISYCAGVFTLNLTFTFKAVIDHASVSLTSWLCR